jgi:hypothetical protein
LKQAAEKRFVFRKRHHAVADVAGREDAILAAQAAGAAAVIGDRDDGGEIGDGTIGAGVLVGAADDEFLESLRFGGALFHAGIRDGGTGFLLQKRI